ncbi:hypothetical protein Ahy_B01g056360 [Arachis hypogaea]|uniref:SWIM-type domain-containing protein n=1 Tax=Arachis hypogaea TaxID=3818 RepID=A0A445AYP9_ARAHY|nr:hypothetical protein Ahy_B01g056360 [Arachis hypogaea]
MSNYCLSKGHTYYHSGSNLRILLTNLTGLETEEVNKHSLRFVFSKSPVYKYEARLIQLASLHFYSSHSSFLHICRIRCAVEVGLGEVEVMKNIANSRVYYNGEVIPNTHEGVTFVCECTLSFAISCTMSFVELQNGLCNNIQSHILKMVSNILYRNPVQVFGGLIQFQMMPITDDGSICSRCYLGLGAVGEEVNVDEVGVIDWEEDNNDSEEEFEANYEVDDKNDDRDLAGNPAVQNEADSIISQHPFGVPSFMRTLDLEDMHAPEFPEYANMGEGNTAAEDGEFSVGMEFCSRESVISAIKSYTISRGVDYTTFYAKCKGYGAGCDWRIRASLIRKKACWEIRRYNGKHTCTMGTISQDHAKLDSDTIAEAIRPLSAEAHERVRNGFTYSEFSTKRVEESSRCAGNIVVNRFDKRNEMFEVCEMQDGSVYTVNLVRRHCDYGRFQVERLPCRHVLACCVNQRLDWQVYVHDMYKMSEICKVYRCKFVPMGDPSTWDKYEGVKVIANWTLRRMTKERPKSTRDIEWLSFSM